MKRNHDASSIDEVGLRIAGLRHHYREAGRERPVLDGVELEMQAGECVALLGRSGSGKSTLLNLISGIERPAAGHVAMAGRVLTQLSERDRTLFRRRHMGFVYQSFNLLPTLTVIENIQLPLELNGLPPEPAIALLEDVGLADRAGTFPDRLSGGEQQRLAIARALVHRPALVLADEPTGNLDADNGRKVLHLLDRLVRRSGGMLLIVTHAREVAAMADRILLLVDGRLVAGEAAAVW